MIEFNNVTKYYNEKTPALKNISFSAEKGDGKQELLQIIFDSFAEGWFWSRCHKTAGFSLKSRLFFLWFAPGVLDEIL